MFSRGKQQYRIPRISIFKYNFNSYLLKNRNKNAFLLKYEFSMLFLIFRQENWYYLPFHFRHIYHLFKTIATTISYYGFPLGCNTQKKSDYCKRFSLEQCNVRVGDHDLNYVRKPGMRVAVSYAILCHSTTRYLFITIKRRHVIFFAK